MKSLIHALSIVLVLMTNSCSKDEVPGSAASFDTLIFITILDKQGNNLLDPNQEGYYDPRHIKIFYDRNGRMEEFYEGHLDMPRNFRIDAPEFERDYVMALVLDSEKTIIRWNEHESDTIQAEFHKTDFPSIRVTKVYFNSELKWDIEDLIGREITIIK